MIKTIKEFSANLDRIIDKANEELLWGYGIIVPETALRVVAWIMFPFMLIERRLDKLVESIWG